MSKVDHSALPVAFKMFFSDKLFFVAR